VASGKHPATDWNGFVDRKRYGVTGGSWPARYEVRVEGVLEQRRWSEWFEGLEVERAGDETILSGTLPDQPALYGVLDKVRDLGLTVIVVRRLPRTETTAAIGLVPDAIEGFMPEPRGLLDPVQAYLAEPRCAVLSTVGPDGAPRQAVVHYLLERDALIVNGRANRHWVSNLRRDQRVSVVVHDADQPLHWVGVKGSAELLRTGKAAVDDAMAMARRYGEVPAAYQDQQRVSFRIVPWRLSEYG
jgi:PPOX class probable F420-dependent enzyme